MFMFVYIILKRIQIRSFQFNQMELDKHKESRSYINKGSDDASVT